MAGAREKYRLARGILEVLRDSAYPGFISILTKSPLVLRDIEVIGALRVKEVGVTVTTTDDTIGRFMEAHAPVASDRLNTLAELNRAGIPTYAFVGPLFPHYRFRVDLLEQLFRALRDAGTKTIFAEHSTHHNISFGASNRFLPTQTLMSEQLTKTQEPTCIGALYQTSLCLLSISTVLIFD